MKPTFEHYSSDMVTVIEWTAPSATRVRLWSGYYSDVHNY
jgi:hypothetical protein